MVSGGVVVSEHIKGTALFDVSCMTPRPAGQVKGTSVTVSLTQTTMKGGRMFT